MFLSLDYIYIASDDFEKDFEYYKNVLNAHLVWSFKEFGANVAAFDFCGKPFLLIADHLQAPGNRLIFRVENLDQTTNDLKDRGWKSDGDKFEIPDGPCYNFSDPSGNKYAVYEATRPGVLEKEYKKYEH